MQGQAGLPNFRMGDALRVPAAALEKMLGRPLSSIPPPRRREPSAAQTPPPPAAGGQLRELRPRPAPLAAVLIGRHAGRPAAIGVQTWGTWWCAAVEHRLAGWRP